MKIDIKKLLVKTLPFLFKLATRVWHNTSKEKQDSAIRAVKIVQKIKDLGRLSPADVKKEISTEFNISITTIDAGLTAMAIAINRSDLSTDDMILYIQIAQESITDDILENRLYKTAAEAWAQYESAEKFDWKELAFGIIQIAFEIVFKGGVK